MYILHDSNCNGVEQSRVSFLPLLEKMHALQHWQPWYTNNIDINILKPNKTTTIIKLQKFSQGGICCFFAAKNGCGKKKVKLRYTTLEINERIVPLVNWNFVSVDDQFAAFGRNLALVLSVRTVVLEHVHLTSTPDFNARQFMMYAYTKFPSLSISISPCGAGAPLFPLVHFLLHLLPFLLFLFFHWLTYFLLLSIPSLSTRIVPLRFQAGGRRKRPNLGLVCCV